MKVKKNIVGVFLIILIFLCPVAAQDKTNNQQIHKSMKQSDALFERFSRKCERRTKKAERRFGRYERKMNNGTQEDMSGCAGNQEAGRGTGKEPMLDSLRLVHEFAEFAGLPTSDANIKRAQKQAKMSKLF